jgi:hypothetical protein
MSAMDYKFLLPKYSIKNARSVGVVLYEIGVWEFMYSAMVSLFFLFVPFPVTGFCEL